MNLDLVHPKTKPSASSFFFQVFFSQFVHAFIDCGVKNPNISEKRVEGILNQILPYIKRIIEYGIFTVQWNELDTAIFQLSLLKPEIFVPLILEKIQVGLSQPEFAKTELLQYLKKMIYFVCNFEQHSHHLAWIIPSSNQILSSGSSIQNSRKASQVLTTIYEHMLDLDSNSNLSHLFHIKDDLEEVAITTFEIAISQASTTELDPLLLETILSTSEYVWKKCFPFIEETIMTPSNRIRPRNLIILICRAFKAKKEPITYLIRKWIEKFIMKRSKDPKPAKTFKLGLILSKMKIEKVEYELEVQGQELMLEFVEILAGIFSLTAHLDLSIYKLLIQALCLFFESEDQKIQNKVFVCISAVFSSFKPKEKNTISRANLIKKIKSKKNKTKEKNPKNSIWYFIENENPDRARLIHKTLTLGIFELCFQYLEKILKNLDRSIFEEGVNVLDLYTQLYSFTGQNFPISREKRTERKALYESLMLFLTILKTEDLLFTIISNKKTYLLLNQIHKKFLLATKKVKLLEDPKFRQIFVEFSTILVEANRALQFGVMGQENLLASNQGVSNSFEHHCGSLQQFYASVLLPNYINLYKILNMKEDHKNDKLNLKCLASVLSENKALQKIILETKKLPEEENQNIGYLFDNQLHKILFEDGFSQFYLNLSPLLVTLESEFNQKLHSSARKILREGFVISQEKTIMPVLRSCLQLLKLPQKEERGTQRIVKAIMQIFDLYIFDRPIQKEAERKLVLKILIEIGKKAQDTLIMAGLREIMVHLLKNCYLQPSELQKIPVKHISTQMNKLISSREDVVSTMIVATDILTCLRDIGSGAAKDLLQKLLMAKSSETNTVNSIRKALVGILYIKTEEKGKKEISIKNNENTMDDLDSILNKTKQKLELIKEKNKELPDIYALECLRLVPTKNEILRYPLKFYEGKENLEICKEECLKSIFQNLASVFKTVLINEKSNSRSGPNQQELSYTFLFHALKLNSTKARQWEHYSPGRIIDELYLLAQLRLGGPDLFLKGIELLNSLELEFSSHKILGLKLVFYCCGLQVASFWPEDHFKLAFTKFLDFITNSPNSSNKIILGELEVVGKAALKNMNFGQIKVFLKELCQRIECKFIKKNKILLKFVLSTVLNQSQGLITPLAENKILEIIKEEKLQNDDQIWVQAKICGRILQTGVILPSICYNENLNDSDLNLEIKNSSTNLEVLPMIQLKLKKDIQSNLLLLLQKIQKEKISDRLRYVKTLIHWSGKNVIGTKNYSFFCEILKLMISIDPEEDPSHRDMALNTIGMIESVIPIMQADSQAIKLILEHLENNYQTLRSATQKRTLFKIYFHFLEEITLDKLKFITKCFQIETGPLGRELPRIMVRKFKGKDFKELNRILIRIEKEIKK